MKKISEIKVLEKVFWLWSSNAMVGGHWSSTQPAVVSLVFNYRAKTPLVCAGVVSVELTWSRRGSFGELTPPAQLQLSAALSSHTQPCFCSYG